MFSVALEGSQPEVAITLTAQGGMAERAGRGLAGESAESLACQVACEVHSRKFDEAGNADDEGQNQRQKKQSAETQMATQQESTMTGASRACMPGRPIGRGVPHAASLHQSLTLLGGTAHRTRNQIRGRGASKCPLDLGDSA